MSDFEVLRMRAEALVRVPNARFTSEYNPLTGCDTNISVPPAGRLKLDVTALLSGGPPVFPTLPKELLTSVSTGVWKKEEDGPASWRRSVYVYRKRGLAFPMFQVFDLPEQNVAAGARTVSTVPTQALTLLNDASVLRQAQVFADRVKKEAGDDPANQIDLAYRIALTRPPTQTELAMALDAIKTQSLVDLTDVLLNLNEFVYIR